MLQLLQACCYRTNTCRRRCRSLQGWLDIWRTWLKTLRELWLFKHLQRGCIPTKKYNTLVCKVLFPLNHINLHFQAFNKPLHLFNSIATLSTSLRISVTWSLINPWIQHSLPMLLSHCQAWMWADALWFARQLKHVPAALKHLPQH